MVFHGCQMPIRHFTAAKCACSTLLLKKFIHLLKATGKKFDLLKPKSYLSRLEDIARDAA